MPEQPDVDIWTLSDLCTPWCIHVVATLRIADHIAAGITRIDDLAGVARCDTESLHRVLRHLVSKGVFAEPQPRHFALNAVASQLCDPGHTGLDLDGIGGRMAHVWGSLLDVVRTGKPHYQQVFGRPFWEDLEAHPEIAASFDALMGPAGHGVPDPEVLPSGNWRGVCTVVDVGGGTGAMLAEILRAHPTLRGILVDMPRTVARSAAVFEAAGVSERVTMVGRSIFDPLPGGADLYILKNLLADFPDAEAGALLRRCAEAARPNGRVMVRGGVSPDDDGRGAAPELLMLVLMVGKDRTLAEFRELAQDAGLRIETAGWLRDGHFAVECRPI